MSRMSQIPSVSIASHVAGRKVFDLVVPALDETYKATRRVGSSGGLAHGHVLADMVELVGSLCARMRVQNNYASPCNRQHACGIYSLCVVVPRALVGPPLRNCGELVAPLQLKHVTGGGLSPADALHEVTRQQMKKHV